MPLRIIFTLLFGMLTGFSLGALGSGGSILALPAFVYAAGVPVKSAVATSLAVVGATSFIGALLAWRRCATRGCPGQEVDGRLALLFSVGGLFGSFAGARLARFLPDGVQMLVFAAAMLAAAIGMLRRRSPALEALNAGKSILPTRALWLMVLPGLGVGLLTGVIGVGGGFLIVPALTLLAGVPVKKAVSTSLWIIAANSTMGVFGYVGRVPFAWNVAFLFLTASVGGMLAGLWAARIARPAKLQRAFAFFLMAVGVFTAFQITHRHMDNRSAAHPIAAKSAGAMPGR